MKQRLKQEIYLGEGIAREKRRQDNTLVGLQVAAFVFVRVEKPTSSTGQEFIAVHCGEVLKTRIAEEWSPKPDG